MRLVRRTLAVLLLVGMATMPLPGCAGGGGPMGQLMGLALGLGVSLGSYWLVNELK